MHERSSFFAELQRRHVYKVGAAYVVAAWLLVQVVTQVFPVFGIGALAQRILVIAIVAGIVPALVLAWIFDLTPGGPVRTGPIPAEGEPTQVVRQRASADRRLNYVLGALLVAALAYAIAARVRGPDTAGTALAAAPSIAVLPLINTSGDPSNEYFSDGLSEELIAVLAKIPALKIVGRSSSFQFKGKSEDSASIGDKLGVTHLLEGSVRRQGDRVRIVAELIQARDGHAVWTETYDRELKDVFAVQNEIATAVAEQLRVQLLGTPERSEFAPSNDNLAAYGALQLGNFHFSQGTEAGMRKAIDQYAEAVRLDPRYGLAYAKLSTAWRWLAATWTGGAESMAAYGKAREAAKTALELSPNLAEAHVAVGFVLMQPDFEFAASEAEFRKAVALAPQDADSQTALAYALAAQGRLAESEALERYALALDPLSIARYLNIARLEIADGRYDAAEADVRKAMAIQPAAARLHVYLTFTALLRGRTAEALEAARAEPPGFWNDYAMAMAQQLQGDPAVADAALERFIGQARDIGPFQIATVYGLRKDPDRAFEWLDRAFVARDAGLTQLLVIPFLLPYKDDPRFAAACRRLKVPVPQ